MDWYKRYKIDNNRIYVSITREFKKNCYLTDLYLSNLELDKLFFQNIITNPNKICADINSSFESYPSFKNFNGYQTGGRVITDSKIFT